MKSFFDFRQIFLIFFIILFTGTLSTSGQDRNREKPKNIILMISDGCGYNHILATDYYLDGKAGSQTYESFPVRLGMSNYPAKLTETGDLIDPGKGYIPDSAWSSFSYMEKGWVESAAAASTMACGQKTYNNSINVDINHQPMYSISQLAEEKGKSAGVVTTVPINYGTPAAFAAHNPDRSNYISIAREMILDSKLEVIMGCGNPDYDKQGNKINDNKSYIYVGGKASWDSLISGATDFSEASDAGNRMVGDIDGDGKQDPWSLIQDRSEFQALMAGETPKRVLGIPKTRSTLQQLRNGRKDTLPFAVPFSQNVPTLKEMALGALNVLDNNPAGFFLMIEGGAVDWANHDHQPGRMIEEEAGFNEAADAVICWIETHGGWKNTLLVVTGDHESGYLTGPKERDNSPLSNPIINNGKGKIPGMKFNSTDHSNQLIPLFAKGKGAKLLKRSARNQDPVRGRYLDNTDLAKVFFWLWEK